MQHRAKKRLGQNFLVDNNIIERIVSSISPASDDLMIEIGPGLGALTGPVLDRVSHLHVIELDHDVIPRLRDNIGPEKAERLTVHEHDVLKFDFAALYHTQHHAHHHSRSHDQAASQKLRIIGNLPYNISTPVLFHLLKNREIIDDMHFMLQKEVVERIVAAPGNGTYGRLSVMLQAFFQVTALFKVPPQAFRPAPRVDSAILRLVPDNRYSRSIADFGQFETLVRSAFGQRRKTLRNTLKKIVDATQIEAAGLNPGQRAEELSVADFISLSQIADTNA